MPDDTYPDFRVTLSPEGNLMFEAWHRGLFNPGPLSRLFDQPKAAGATIADLTITGEDDEEHECIVEFICVADRRRAEHALTGWARDAGHQRIWFDDSVVDLTDRPPTLNTAGVTCGVCASTWEDGDAEFWLMVRGSGYFPLGCPICGATLPQWAVGRRRRAARRHAKVKTSRR